MPLQSAWEYLSTDGEREAFDQADPMKLISEVKSPNSILGALKEIVEISGRQQQAAQARQNIRAHFETRIQNALFNESYFGFGYPIAPYLARTPRRIDPALWDGFTIDWSVGKVWLDNIAFNRVRIVDPYDYPQFDLAPKRPGPISYADQINWALKYHSENDPDFWELTDLIRTKRLKKTIYREFNINPDQVRGFSNKTFEKYISKFKSTR